MRKSIVWAVACIVVTVGLFGCGSSSSGTNPATDRISITSVSPASVATGTNTTFAIEVSYSLASKDSGLLMVGFNTNQVDLFRMISSETFTVSMGSGTHIFNAIAIPVDWGSAGTFQAYVNLSENPHPSTWTPLACDKKTISLSASAAPLASKSSNAFKFIKDSVQCNNNVCL